MEKEKKIKQAVPWICLTAVFILVSICFCLRQFSVSAGAEVFILLLIPVLYLIPHPVISMLVCILSGVGLLIFAKQPCIYFFSVPLCFLLQKLADDPAATNQRDTFCKTAVTAYLIGHLIFCVVSYRPTSVMLVEWPIVLCLVFTAAVLLLNVVLLLKERKLMSGMKKKIRFWKTVSCFLPVPAAAISFVYAVSDGLLYGYPRSFFLPFILFLEWGLLWTFASVRKESAAHFYYEKLCSAFSALFLV